ncbi:DUF7666 domain-containing protein [Coprococcus phoceensis]|uniref:DUF7666 domain-containing protein n=1 Tax=Coprococcus phoceensis TaxID=1870993 RepID=UPI00356988EC
MKGFKGFNPDFTCRGKQYEENKIFEEEAAEICESGMHFCENPFEVLRYYNLVNKNGKINEFAEVEALDEALTNDNKKYCTKKLKIGAKLGLEGFVKACVDFTIEKTSFEFPDSNIDSGDSAKIGSSGYSAKIGSSGYSAQIGSSGDSAKIGSSGYSAQIGSSGNYAQIGSSGDSAKIGSSGDYAQIGSSGNYAQIGSSGDYARIDSSGKHSVVMCAGYNSMAKAKIGSWITLAEWKKNSDGKWIPVCVKTEQVDGERIKEDTFYKLEDGEFKEYE